MKSAFIAPSTSQSHESEKIDLILAKMEVFSQKIDNIERKIAKIQKSLSSIEEERNEGRSKKNKLKSTLESGIETKLARKRQDKKVRLPGLSS